MSTNETNVTTSKPNSRRIGNARDDRWRQNPSPLDVCGLGIREHAGSRHRSDIALHRKLGVPPSGPSGLVTAVNTTSATKAKDQHQRTAARLPLPSQWGKRCELTAAIRIGRVIVLRIPVATKGPLAIRAGINVTQAAWPVAATNRTGS